jgi:ubiquinone/menaquinone biosynthesis C-methylase UbiE
VDLLPADIVAEARWRRWANRQEEMTEAYRDLIRDRAHTLVAYHSDHDPFANRLAEFSGRVLDVGGGHGILRRVLPEAVDYISVDPSLDWFDDAWDAVSDEFACFKQPLQFVRGIAEHLPFASGSFDGALSLWSLNHCADPRMAIAEIARVLKPGAVFLLVLEDVEPPLGDILNGSYTDHRQWSRRRTVFEKLKAAISGWPLQSDHVRISEGELAAWTREMFSPAYRSWQGSYLTTGFARKGAGGGNTAGIP